jgi:hypothetical protein
LLSNEYDIYLTLVGPKTNPGALPPIADRDGVPPVQDASQTPAAAVGTG